MVVKVWENPDIFNIQVELPRNPLQWLNVYVIMTPERNLMIDTGFNFPECRKALWSGVEELNLDLRKTSLFLSHLHTDHTGLAGEFADRNCPIYMGRIDYNYMTDLRNGDSMLIMEKVFQQEGFPAEELARHVMGNQGRWHGGGGPFPAQMVDDGAVITLGGLEIQCVHTPGHTPGHMVLYLPKEQLLFTGDHILFDITPNIVMWSGVPHSLEDYLGSLEKIRALPIRAAFPAHRHGEGDVYQRIDALLRHHRERLEEILQTVRDHPASTAYQIAGMISWSAQGLGWDQFPFQQKWFALGETLAHLRWLEDHGQALRAEAGQGPAVWKAVP